MADNRQSDEISILAQLSEGNSGDASSSGRAAAEKRSKPAGSRSISSKKLSAKRNGDCGILGAAIRTAAKDKVSFKHE